MVGTIDFALCLGVIGLFFSLALFMYVRSQPVGNARMAELANAIHQGAMAFLRREYTVLLPFIAVVAALLFWLVGPRTAVAYGLGAACSIMAGFFGMQAATSANVRTSEAARAEGQGEGAPRRVLRRGAVMGTAVAALGLLGIGAVVMIYDPAGRRASGRSERSSPGSPWVPHRSRCSPAWAAGSTRRRPMSGPTSSGKSRRGSRRMIPRNPATIADNVGDNVGDVAGMGADIFESYVGFGDRDDRDRRDQLDDSGGSRGLAAIALPDPLHHGRLSRERDRRAGDPRSSSE